MRKITQQSIAAFMSNTQFKQGNTRVLAGERTILFLHGHLIAVKDKDKITITNAGWQSNTTKERLNGIPGVSISQKKGIWYLNGNQWDGKLIKVS